ncbi:hypothetical protein AUJ44_03085 [Candidatus Nomurabacteria bacterium CG1_02_47_685]|uniref:Uncharacterized protein n=1 Tax=Candidatus Nomurabacteria bacterium CG1_02_47_685 TaxID=1805282 RepID=A0A1J4VDF1_9BACT|nr:MAG: hypothetical protein AUJ44_03085 [Candidatus Nomurabacteria bacterium CG1_02_47_685]
MILENLIYRPPSLLTGKGGGEGVGYVRVEIGEYLKTDSLYYHFTHTLGHFVWLNFNTQQSAEKMHLVSRGTRWKNATPRYSPLRATFQIFLAAI